MNGKFYTLNLRSLISTYYLFLLMKIIWFHFRLLVNLSFSVKLRNYFKHLIQNLIMNISLICSKIKIILWNNFKRMRPSLLLLFLWGFVQPSLTIVDRKLCLFACVDLTHNIVATFVYVASCHFILLIIN